MYIAYKSRIQKTLRFFPEFIICLAISLGVGDERRNKLQDVFLTVDILKRVIMHRLLEVDRIEHLYPVSVLQKCVACLFYESSFWISKHN